MCPTESPIPQPEPVCVEPPDKLPPEHEPLPPGPLRVTQVIESNEAELAIIYKRTYTIDSGQRCRLAEEQIPLDDEGAEHDPIAPDVQPSAKSLPEIIGLKRGTDLVVQASARSRTPARQMTVGVQVGRFQHTAVVFGRRVCEYVNGKLRFGDPEPFEDMPLRYENAYGGRDPGFEKALMDEVKATTPRDRLRRGLPTAELLMKANHPLMSPRNRFGKGYVLEERPDLIEGRELPNLERPDDLLTPERLIVGNPLDWLKQPLPVGFDYLDPLSFPRSAMMGMPPATPANTDFDQVAEVQRQLIEADYCRGNVFAASPQSIPDLIHIDVSRCASLGLQLPFFRGDEEVILTGMDPIRPIWRLILPGEGTRFHVSGLTPAPEIVKGKLMLLHVDMHERRLNLIWSGRMRLKRAINPPQAKKIAGDIEVRIVEIQQ